MKKRKRIVITKKRRLRSKRSKLLASQKLLKSLTSRGDLLLIVRKSSLRIGLIKSKV